MRFATILICLLSLMISACATVQKTPLIYAPGTRLETLSSAVSLSVRSSAGSMGGHGFMVYRRPDQIHLVVLSPFGTTVLEAFANGDRITLVYPSQGVAYSGRFDELPDANGLQGWRLMRWVMDAEPSDQAGKSGSEEHPRTQGGRETVTYESGLITAKKSTAGEQVYYRDYTMVNGVPLAKELEIHNSRTDMIRIKLQEPEVNTTLDAAAFTPRLEGLKVLPFSALPVK
jgi:hypothetical protein